MGIALIGALFFSSCQTRETETKDPASKNTLKAYLEGDTKTTLSPGDNGTYKVLWSEGDNLGVFVDGNNTAYPYELVEGEGTKQGTFSGFGKGESYIGIYPFSITKALEGQEISLEIPQEQTGGVGSFDNGMFPMIARSNSSELPFKNLMSLLKLSITGHHTVTSIEFTSADPSCTVSGEATVNANYASSPELVMSQEGSASVTLSTGNVALDDETPTVFYIALPPQVYKGGFSVKISTTTGYMVKTYDKDFEMVRSMVHEAAPFAVKLDEGVEPAVYLEGSGTKEDPFLIGNLGELLYMQSSVNTVEGVIKTSTGEKVTANSAYYKLTSDIDMSLICNEETGQSWVPIGDYGTDESLYFIGTFDGNGHKISNLYISGPGRYRAFFGKTVFDGIPGTILNLTVQGHVIGQDYYVAMIAGEAGTVDNCTAEGVVDFTTKSYYTGGICGSGTNIYNCVNSASVRGVSMVGGITGLTSTMIRGCTNNGEIIATNSEVGGIVGYLNAGSLYNCRNNGNISGKNTKAGGIAGYNRQSSIIANCINTGNVSSGNGEVGGISGVCDNWNDPPTTAIRNCVNAGEVSITGSNPTSPDTIGSIVGNNNSIVSQCYYLYDPDLGTGLEKGIGSQTEVGQSDNLFPLTTKEMYGDETSVILYTQTSGLLHKHLLGALNAWAYDNRSQNDYWGWQYAGSNTYPSFTGTSAKEPSEGDDLFNILVPSVEIGAAGGEVHFDVMSTMGYYVSSIPDWIHEGSSEKLEDQNMTTRHYFTVDMYSGNTERTGTIVFCNDKQECVPATVTQQPMGSEIDIILSTSSISFTSEGGQKNLNILANLGWKMTIDQNWLKSSASESQSGNASVTLSAERNTTGSSRVAHVTITSDDGTITRTVNVAQSSKKDFVVEEWKDRNFYHRSLFMRFTATWCGWCPRMNITIKTAQQEYPDKLVHVALHNSDSDLAFDGTMTLRSTYGVNSFPTGLVDGRIIVTNQETDIAFPKIIAASKETEENYGTATGIALSSSVTGREILVNVDAFIKQKGNYKVSVLLLEDGIIGPQVDYVGATTSSYQHDNVARMALSDISGESFSTTEDYSVKSFAYSATIPEGYDIEKMKVLVFIQTEYGSRTPVRTRNFGSFFVDNCAVAKVGETLGLEAAQNSSGGNEGINPGDDIDM